MQIPKNLLALVLCAAGAVHAQSDYPSKPIRIVVPLTPGGPGDTVSRLFAARMSERLRQPVLVENRPGAGGLIGADAVVRSPPDGYTVLSSSGTVFSRALVKNQTIDLARDLAPVGRTYGGSLVLMVSGGIPVRTMREFIDYAKANPGKINYGNTGVTPLLAMEVLKKLAAFEATRITYKGGAPNAIALSTGEVQVTIDAPLPYMAFIQSGKVRPIAVGADQRLAILPDVPSNAEAGYPDFKAFYSSGLWAPAGTPREVIERLNAAVVEAARSPELQDTVRKAGLYVSSSSPQAFLQGVQAELDFLAEAAKLANYQPE
jgi:tripartite-type tricarboxylate transporter receptor subunit TctC